MFTFLDNVKPPKEFCIEHLTNKPSSSNVNKDDEDKVDKKDEN